MTNGASLKFGDISITKTLTPFGCELDYGHENVSSILPLI